MGMFLTLLYILASYLSPEVIFGSMAEYRSELVVAILATLASLFSLQGSNLTRVPQALALIGISFVVFLSFVFNGLFGLAPSALLGFLPQAFTFFLVFVNFRKKWHLQLLTLVLMFVCLFTIYHGYEALNSGRTEDPYLFSMGGVEEGTRLYRIRGLADINDPNDFAQLIVAVIPCVFFFWRKKNLIWNVPVVLVPVGFLIYGMFLTHSRGSILALLSILIIAGRRKFGTVPALVSAGFLFSGATAIGWSGGRDISVEAGADRLEAWSTGLGLIKSHPIFGVGFKRFTEFYEITAHNSIVVCAAELGLVGLFFWVMFILPSVRDMIVVGTSPAPAAPVEEESPYASRQPSWGHATAVLEAPARLEVATVPAVQPGLPTHLAAGEKTDSTPEEEIRRMGRLMVTSLAGFLIAGWFLSRSYVMTLYTLVGMSQVLYEMALRREMVPPHMQMGRLVKLTAWTAVGLVTAVYIILRLQRLTGR